MTTTKSHVTCPLCEATCGLTVTMRGREIEDIRGDRDDVFSAGYICPKAYALKELDADPDRLRQPLVRRDGALRARVGWDEAMAEIDRGLGAIFREHGRDAVAVYLGNPNAPSPLGALHAGPHQGDRHPQRLLGEHGRPDAEAGLGGLDVRHRAVDPGPRPRPHRLSR